MRGLCARQGGGALPLVCADPARALEQAAGTTPIRTFTHPRIHMRAVDDQAMDRSSKHVLHSSSTHLNIRAFTHARIRTRAVDNQAVDRAYRIGQARDVVVYR